MSLLIGNKEEIKMNLQGKKVLVFGSGKSGIGAAELLAKVGAQPVIYDGNKDLDKETVIASTLPLPVRYASSTSPHTGSPCS